MPAATFARTRTAASRCFAAVLVATVASGVQCRAEAPTQAAGNLKQQLMTAMSGMDAHHSGLFNDDITSVVAARFPRGQSMTETETVLKQQGLGPLRAFKGKPDPGMGTMFVSTTMLTINMGAEVKVVIDFDYDGSSGGAMTLRSVKAFVRSTSM